jgi:hypothetical protein
MPQLPVLIPIIVTGLLVGSVMTHEGRGISKKRFAVASVLSGLLNGGQAYLVNLLTPQPTSFIRTGVTIGTAGPGFAVARQGSELVFIISSFLVGILIPLAVVGIAKLYAHFRKGEEDVEVEEPISEK